MSLTSELKDKNSAVGAYIRDCAPVLAQAGGRGALGKEQAAAFGFGELIGLPAQAPIPATAESRRAHATLTGTAFDYRVRMMLADFDPRATVAAAGVDSLSDLAERMTSLEHAAQIMRDAFYLAADYIATGHDRERDRAAVLLAWGESLYRAGVSAIIGSLGAMLHEASAATDLLYSIPKSVLTDLAALRALNAPQIDSWRQQIAAGVPFAPNPGFQGSWYVGGADADWIIGTTLIDCKTREKIAAPWIRESLFQLLGYALLDFDDDLFIENVALWLPRQGVLKSWTIGDLIGTDDAKVLAKLRKGLLRKLTR